MSKKFSWLNPKVLLGTLSLFAVTGLASETVNPAQANVKFVNPEWVTSNASDSNLRILDVRTTPLDYFTSHIVNAVNLPESVLRAPLNGLPVQYLPYNLLGQAFSSAGVNDKSRVVIYSDGVGILGASLVAYALERSGFTNEIAILDGGFADYKANSPVTKEFPKYTPTPLKVVDNPSVRVTLSEVGSLIGKPNVVFIDPRPPKFFRGEDDTFTRNGHIPGAVNIPWQTFTLETNNHKLKPLADISQILADKKIVIARLG